MKPANVLLSAEGVPKLADFNVSMAGSAGRAGAAATLGGSIGYMAPEHLAAIGGMPGSTPDDVAEAADLYSLAVLLWELARDDDSARPEGSQEAETSGTAEAAGDDDEGGDAGDGDHPPQMLVAVSDKMKSKGKQAAACQEKDQSVHLFMLP